MQLAFRILVAALAFTGSLSLLVSGELNLLFVLPGLAMIPGYYRYIRGYEPVSRWLIAGLALVELGVVAFDSLMVSGDFFIAVAHMTIIFQALKSFDMREAWDPLQVYFMSMLQVVMTSELTLSIAMGGVFVVFLFIFMAALVFSHFMKEGTLEKVKFRAPLITISVVALLATLLFFISIPRVRGEIWGRDTSSSIRTVGFTENVDFGSFGRVLEDPSIVIRAELEGPDLPLYWRGKTHDSFDGLTWFDTLKQRRYVTRRSGGVNVVRRAYRGEVTTQKIIIEPLDTDIVFGLGKIVTVESRAWRIYESHSGAVTMPQKKNRRFTYTVHSAPASGMKVKFRQNYLQLPKGMERVAALAEQVAGEGTDFQKARRIDEYLRANYKYSLTTRQPPEWVTPLMYFLFDSKEGFCEYYATAMIMMLRTQGIPARMVTGFKGGEENAYGNYVIVRQSNAHSWVEVAIDDEWVRFDPTPLADIGTSRGFVVQAFDALRMSWYRYVVGFSSRDQLRMLKSFSTPMIELPDIKGIKVTLRPVYFIAVLVPVGLFTFWFGRRLILNRRLSYASREYLRLRDRIKRKGGRISASSSPRDVLREARKLYPNPGEIERSIRLYEDARFGGRTLSAEEREELRTHKGKG